MPKKIFQKFGIIFFFILTISANCTAGSDDWSAIWQAHPFYFGGAFGWGCTDWSQLVARISSEEDRATLTLSAPISAGDTGAVYGVMMGYEINPHFAIEANYMRFPNTPITFDEFNLYDIQKMDSISYVYNTVGKFMVQVNHTGLRGFANAGGALIHRQDQLVDVGHISPTFGIGLDYVLSKRVMLELAFQYYAGFGKAVLKPVINYIPFLYTVHLKLGFRF